MTATIWFTADHHFGHANILGFCKRPFATVEQMNETLIAHWNRVVGPQDLVYHLGDIFLMPAVEARKIRQRLHGRICLVRGNHDKTADSLKSGFEWIKDYYELKVDDAEAPGGRRRVVLCHYAFRVWNKSHHGSWHLYGHSHGSLGADPNSLSLDVGVDCHGYMPLCYTRVKEIMAAKTFVPLDHHGRGSKEEFEADPGREERD
jgi:calcineurin-like phosphoesterase family protein